MTKKTCYTCKHLDTSETDSPCNKCMVIEGHKRTCNFNEWKADKDKIKMMKERKCPECGSLNIETEHTKSGMTDCLDCGYFAPSSVWNDRTKRVEKTNVE